MMDVEAQRKEHKERTERRKANWLYVQQHLAAELVACATSWQDHMGRREWQP